MRTELIILSSPLFNQYRCLGERSEYRAEFYGVVATNYGWCYDVCEHKNRPNYANFNEVT